MRKLFLFLYLSMLLLFSCGERRPHDVISFNDMRSVMWDMMRADQFMGDYIFAKDTLANKKLVSAKWYGEVLALHNISQQSFKKSYDYYSSHPKLMRDLMDSLSKQNDTSAVWNQPRPGDTVRKTVNKDSRLKKIKAAKAQ